MSDQLSISLIQYLSPLQRFLSDEKNTEVIVNKPGEVITEDHTGWHIHDVPELTYEKCLQLAKLTATFTLQKLSTQSPILSGTLPKGERIQIVIPPATLSGHISLTIRKPANHNFTLAEYKKNGLFTETQTVTNELSENDHKLLKLKENHDFVKFLKLAVKSRKTIIVSGSTGSGKTTLCRTLLDLVPHEERLISIENVDELGLYKTHPNTVSLFYSAGDVGAAPISQQQLLESSLRMKPDRIFVAELIRGEEAFYYLRNINSGHPGSITTLHANSTKLAFEQLVLFLKESSGGSTLSRQDIKQFLYMCVDIVIQISNIKGSRRITEIFFDPKLKNEQYN